MLSLAPLDDPKAVKQVPTRNGFGEGLIEAGKKHDDVAIKKVDFQPDPTPVMSATITYDKP